MGLDINHVILLSNGIQIWFKENVRMQPNFYLVAMTVRINILILQKLWGFLVDMDSGLNHLKTCFDKLASLKKKLGEVNITIFK